MEVREQEFLKCVIDDTNNVLDNIITVLSKDGLLLSGYGVQTEEMCVTAVKQNPKSFEFIKTPTNAVIETTIDVCIEILNNVLNNAESDSSLDALYSFCDEITNGTTSKDDTDANENSDDNTEQNDDTDSSDEESSNDNPESNITKPYGYNNP